MKTTSRTWVLLVILLALVAFWLYQKYKPETPAVNGGATPTETVKPVEFIFPKDEGVVTSILVQGPDGASVSLERVGADWMMTKPDSAKADAAAVEAAASQLTAIPIVASLELSPSDVGLDHPSYTFTVGFSSGNSITVEIGDETPTETGYYVRKEGGNVVVVSKDGIDALTAMLQAPPYAETPTPSPTPAPTETPTLTPAVTNTVTPEPGAETPTVTKMP